jgi:trigger factor
MNARIPELTKDVKEKAKERLIIHFVLEKIIEKENFTVSDEDISQEYEKMSKTYQMPVDQVKERYQSDEALVSLKSKICKIKAIDFIINNVNMKEVEPRKEGQK